MTRDERLIFDQTTKAIQDHPERFERDHYNVRERGKKWGNGIEVWVANGRWALHINHDGTKVADGGVVVMAIAPWRYRLWDACMAIPSSEEMARSATLAHLRTIAA